jgi:hypothetical protein
MRERWYLFGNDPELALELLRHDLDQADCLVEQAALVRFLPNLGRHEEAADWLTRRQPALLQEVHGRAALMRVLQHQGNANPWLAMQPPKQADAFQRFCNELLHGEGAIDLWLGGGLGDQLECLARLHGGLSEHPLRERLRLVFPEASRKAMQPLLSRWWPQDALPWLFASGSPRSLEQRTWISLLPFYGALCNANLLSAMAAAVHHTQPARDTPPALLCCWRSKVDPEEKLWAHLRSLPFTTVLRLYSELIPLARRSGLQIVDITRYKPEEVQSLQPFMPTLQLLEPSLTSLADTAALMHKSQLVLTVDTALVHLARWFHWPTLLLLHQHPDERWQPLLQNRAKPGRTRIIQQVQYNQWADLPNRVVAQLKHWLSLAA